MNTKIGSPTFYTWGYKFIQLSYNIHTYFAIIASNKEHWTSRVFPSVNPPLFYLEGTHLLLTWCQVFVIIFQHFFRDKDLSNNLMLLSPSMNWLISTRFRGHESWVRSFSCKALFTLREQYTNFTSLTNSEHCTHIYVTRKATQLLHDKGIPWLSISSKTVYVLGSRSH